MVKTLIAALAVPAGAICLAMFSNKGTLNPSVEEYYTSFESGLGYWLLLGNARHCGLWAKGALWLFPIGQAQRAMEERLFKRLAPPDDSSVLDAGAGSSVVASYVARQGLKVRSVDLTPLHVEEGKRNIKSAGLSDRVTVEQGDFHDQSGLKSSSFDETGVTQNVNAATMSEYAQKLRDEERMKKERETKAPWMKRQRQIAQVGERRDPLAPNGCIYGLCNMPRGVHSGGCMGLGREGVTCSQDEHALGNCDERPDYRRQKMDEVGLNPDTDDPYAGMGSSWAPDPNVNFEEFLVDLED